MEWVYDEKPDAEWIAGSANENRADWAEAAVETYRLVCKGDNDLTAISDLIGDLGHEESYPQEALVDLLNEATQWLNMVQGERIYGQNLPPKTPDEYWWGFNDGDYGLWREEDY